MALIFKSILFAGFFSLLLASCTENRQASGGPCSYKIKISPATIITIEQIDSIHTDIKFAVVKDSGPDTVTYSHFFREYATKDVIEKRDLRPGNVFQFEEHEIVKGTCNPYYYTLTLKKYDNKK